MKIRSLILVLGMICFRSPVVHADNGGPGVSGGGDSAEAEFVSIGQSLSQRLDGDLGVHFPEVPPTEFKKAVESIQVIMTSLPLQLNGTSRDALNFPNDRKIEVNRPRWLKLTPTEKLNLTFHEYLGILRVEHDAYTVSSRLHGVLGESESLKIISAASPDAVYQCQLIRLNPKDARIQEHCDSGGWFTLTTRNLTEGLQLDPNPFTPSNSYYNEACDLIMGMSKGISLSGSGINFHVQISKPETGGKDWRKRQMDQYANFKASLYSPPETFSLTLTTHDKKSFLGRWTTKSHIMSCQLREK